MMRRNRSCYKKKAYSGPRPNRKITKSQLKAHYGEGVSHADVWSLKNIQMLSFMKCEKCGSTNESNPELCFYKFPCPNLKGNSPSAVRCRSWAEYCWPDKVLTLEELRNVYREKKLLCSRHFPDKKLIKEYGLKLGLPTDFLNDDKKNLVVRTYGKKVSAEQKPNTNIESIKLPQYKAPQASKKVNRPKNDSTVGEKRLDHNFLEGENAAELFETIDEVFETNADVSMYDEEPVVKLEPCDTVLHEGYKCNHCLSSVSGYRYTCVQCDDVDLCASCEASGAHAAHYVLRIPRPRPEEEVAELVKELRNVLKKRPIEDRRPRPVEKIIIPSKCKPTGVDPLQPPAQPDDGPAEQSQSDSETAEFGCENDNVPVLPYFANSPSASTHVDSDPIDNPTSTHVDRPRPRNFKLNHETEANASKRSEDDNLKFPKNANSPTTSADVDTNVNDNLTSTYEDIVTPKRRQRKQYQKAEPATSKRSDEDNLLEFPDITNSPKDNNDADLNEKDNPTSTREDIVTPKRRKRRQYQKTASATYKKSEKDNVLEFPDIANSPTANTHVDSNVKDNPTSAHKDTVTTKRSKRRQHQKTVSATFKKSEKYDVLEFTNIINSPTANTDLDPKVNEDPTNRQEEIIAPKRRKPDLYQKAESTASKEADKIIAKCSKLPNEGSFEDVLYPEKDEKPVKLLTPKDKLKLVLDEAMLSETVQQAKAQIEAEMEIRDSIKLEIDSQNDLRDVEISENDGVDVYTGPLLTFDEQPLDFIIQDEHFADDPLALGPANATIQTQHEQVTVDDGRKKSKKRSKRNKRTRV